MLKEKALAVAVIVSAIWHLFWLSAITVVSSPQAGPRVKFSKVSFLGPILEAAPTQMQAAPAERSPLEKRYLAGVGRAALRPDIPPAGRSGTKEAPQADSAFASARRDPPDWTRADFDILKDGKLSDLIRSAVGESRVEPPF
jgi:hypothetical protein